MNKEFGILNDFKFYFLLLKLTELMPEFGIML